MWPIFFFFWITTPTPTLGAGLVSSIGTRGRLFTFCPESLLVYVAGALINKTRDGKTYFCMFLDSGTYALNLLEYLWVVLCISNFFGWSRLIQIYLRLFRNNLICKAWSINPANIMAHLIRRGRTTLAWLREEGEVQIQMGNQTMQSGKLFSCKNILGSPFFHFHNKLLVVICIAK